MTDQISSQTSDSSNIDISATVKKNDDQVLSLVQKIEDGKPFWVRPEQKRGWTGSIRHKLRPVRLFYSQMCWRARMRARYYVFGYRPAKPCFIVAEGRSGSNLLVDYCSSIPFSFAVEEILNPKSVIGLRSEWVSNKTVLRHIELSIAAPAGTSWCFAKLPYTHMRWKKLSYAAVLDKFPHATFIVLYREALAKQYVSWCRLYMTGQERSRNLSKAGELPITIDPLHFEEFCQRMRRTYESVLGDPTLQKHATILSYEELASEPQRVFDEKIFPNLGIPSQEIRTSMKRQSSSGLEESITNYTEVKALLESPSAKLKLHLS